MNRSASLPAEELLSALKADIDVFVGDAPQFDDSTMLLLDYRAQAAPALTERTFPADVSALGEVLGFLEEALQGFSCSAKAQIALSVAIEEAFVNVARYAYGDGGGEVALGIGFEEEGRVLTLRMTDGGTPFDPLGRGDPDITLSAEEREIGGLGIYIVKKTMDTVSYAYENGKNILTMTKQL
jgi:sigma-B regulation protein RsbU (phosphoserine phosphatase)